METCAIVLRNLRQHYGPINRKEAELRSEADTMLREVEEYVATLPPWNPDGIPTPPERPERPERPDVVAGNGIGWAVEHMQQGGFVMRAGWNGKNMYLGLQVPDVNSKMTLPYVYICTVQGDLVPWVCSQTDLLADDWHDATKEIA